MEQLIEDCSILDYVDRDVFEEAGHMFRRPDLETLSSYVFQNMDGTNTVYFMDEPVKYLDETGEAQEIDLTLMEDVVDGLYHTTANDIMLHISKQASKGITLAYDEEMVTLFGVDERVVSDMSKELRGVLESSILATDTILKDLDITNVIASLKDVSKSEKVIEDIQTLADETAVTYKNIFENQVELRYTPTNTGVKEEIILSSYQGTNGYDFILKTNGMYVYQDERGYYLAKTKNSEETIRIGNTIVYDAGGNIEDGTLEVKALQEGQLYVLTVGANETFLTDPNTVYPVTIDPSLTVSDNTHGVNAIQDSPVYAGYPDRNFGNYTYNRAGNAGGNYGVGRTVIRLYGFYSNPMYTSLGMSQIHMVKLHVRGSSGSQPVQLLPLTENASWSETGITWNNMGAFASTPIASGTITNGSWTSFDITSYVKGCENGTYVAGRGFVVKGVNETANLTFCSSEYTADTSLRPYITMSYTPSVSIEGASPQLAEGQTKQLTYLARPTGGKATWAVADGTSDVITVSSSGLVTAKKGGIKDVRLTYTIDGTSYVTQTRVYVVITNGVYRIKNNYSNRYLHVEGGGIEQNTNVQQLAVNMSVPISLYQMWKIKHMGYGIYSIRPMHKLDMGLNITGDNIDIVSIGTSDATSSIPENARWNIGYVTNGYVINKNQGTAQVVSLSGNTTELGANVIKEQRDNTLARQRWTLEKVTTPPTGVILYNVGQRQTVGEEETMIASYYSGSTISQNFTWSINDGSMATLNASTGSIVPVKYGEVTITATHNETGTSASEQRYFQDDYMVILRNEFGFNYDTALLLRIVYDRLKVAYPAESEKMIAWRYTRLIGGFIYNGSSSVVLGIAWNDLAGNMLGSMSLSDYFTTVLGFQENELALLNSDLQWQYANCCRLDYIDFCHLQITVATRLAYWLNRDGIYSNIYWGSNSDELISHYGGWLGDAVLMITSPVPILKNDDYMADLDAENVFRIIYGDAISIITSIVTYYDVWLEQQNRAEWFTHFITYEYAKEQITAILFDGEYDEQTLKTNYVDTYNFLQSIKDELAERGDYT